MAWPTLALLALGKILATSLTLGMGGSGGVFTPSLYIGAVTGGAYGVLLTQLFPSLGLHPEAYALVGMGVVVAVATAAPHHGHPHRLRDDQRLRHHAPADDGRGDRADRGAAPRARLALQRLAAAPRRAPRARRRPRRARPPARGAMPTTPTRRWSARPPRVDQLLEHLGSGEQTEFPVVDPELRLGGDDHRGRPGPHRARTRASWPASSWRPTWRCPRETVKPRGHPAGGLAARWGCAARAPCPWWTPGAGRLIGMITRAHILALYQRAIAGEAPPPEGDGRGGH